MKFIPYDTKSYDTIRSGKLHGLKIPRMLRELRATEKPLYREVLTSIKIENGQLGAWDCGWFLIYFSWLMLILLVLT